MDTPIVDLKNININHDDKNILSDISLSIKKGEFIYLIGKTGSGKSSLLKILYGNLKILDGEANVVGFNIVKIKKKEIPFLRRKLGIVFQDFKLLSDRSIKKNLEFVLRATDWKDKKKIEDRIQTVLEKVKLQNTENKFPHELSGGEQQRIAIARALLNKPELILADEPTGNLDPATSAEIMEVLKKINKSGTTILIATHDYDIISKFPAKTIRIENNKFFELSEKK
jgi:cell division transport system ATP-binding protein|tara:strand:+ start:5107 stop:5787 length:681 start_codon:yes stop_codon:yes gene_type:complete